MRIYLFILLNQEKLQLYKGLNGIKLYAHGKLIQFTYKEDFLFDLTYICMCILYLYVCIFYIYLYVYINSF